MSEPAPPRPPSRAPARGPKKPAWAIEKDRAKRLGPEAVWLFGLHAVRDALLNPARVKRRLILTRNAAQRLGEEALAAGGLAPETADARKFPTVLDPQSVHQGAALEAEPLDWGPIEEFCAPRGPDDLIVLLDRVTDPHNVGAVLRSAEVFGARAVIAPARHSAPETGALAKTASGALERQPYLRVKNLSSAMQTLKDLGWTILGLDGEAEQELGPALTGLPPGPIALALGAEGPGLREKTRETCDLIARIPSAAAFASLNVSNAAAVSLFAARSRS